MSLIESSRTDPTKLNFLFHGTPQPLIISKSVVIDYGGSSNCHTNPLSYYSNHNGYAETLQQIILNESSILYEKMVREFTDETRK